MAATLPKERRVRRRSEFDAVFAGGSKRHGRLMSVTAVASAAPAARLGIAASRRIGGAVVRNRAKRRIREVFRRVEWQPAVDVVVTPRRELIDAPIDDIRAELVSLVAQALRHPRRPTAPVGAAPRRGPRRGV